MNKKQTKSFTEQLKKAFIIVILIPVLCLGGFIYYISFSYIERQKLLESSNMVEQNLRDLNNRIDVCNNSLRYLTANYELEDFLKMNEKNYLQLSRASKNIGSLLYNVMLTNQYYKSLTLYTDKELFVLTDFLQVSSGVKEKDWYEKIIASEGNYWWYEGDKIFLGRKVISAYPAKPIGVIKIELNNEIFADSFNVFQNLPIRVSITKEDTTLYEYEDRGWEEDAKFKQTRDLGNTGWQITYEIDDKYYDHYMLMSFGMPMLVIGIVILLAWAMIYLFSKMLAKDLFILVQEVNQVQKGDLDVQIQGASITEINILSESIQNLLNKIKQLIRQVYVKEIERQDLELNLLQSKISPHFLYNNLSAINWLALECGQDKIYEITTQMATFYRTALNKGKNIDKLAVEMANIKAYVNLQLIAHEDSFDVEYEVQEALLGLDVPIFIMQPLVENAIEHGIDQLRSGRGMIKISGECEGEWLSICIYDNGKILFEKIGEGQLGETDFGYGTGNVHKRIQLLYGAESGLSIRASQTGTIAEIRFLYKHLRLPI